MKPTVLVVKLQQRHHILAGSTRGFVQGLSNPSKEGIIFDEDGIDDEDM
jgi:hypothetical protein